MEGLEPTRREAPDPKSGMATNYITSANLVRTISLFCECKYNTFLFFKQSFTFLFENISLLSIWIITDLFSIFTL